MAIKLLDKPNVAPQDSDYIYGQIKDDTGVGDGTPVNTEVYGDFHQFFARLLDKGGVTPNGLPDNNYSGFQYYDALSNVIDTLIAGVAWQSYTVPGSAILATGATVTPGSGGGTFRYRIIGKTINFELYFAFSFTGTATALTVDLSPIFLANSSLVQFCSGLFDAVDLMYCQFSNGSNLGELICKRIGNSGVFSGGGYTNRVWGTIEIQ